MFKFFDSKIIPFLFIFIMLAGSYLFGRMAGIDSCDRKYKTAIINAQKAKDEWLRELAAINDKFNTELSRQQENDLLKYQELENEFKGIKDNLNSCQLDYKRLRNVYSATQVRLSEATRKSKTESAGITTDNLRPMNCADLHATFLSCAATYANCYNGYTKLWEWTQKVAK